MPKELAYYIRLSLADQDTGTFKDESESVSNQRALIQNYIETHEEFHDWNVQEFVDDGYTGTNGDRPKFQEMLERTKRGKIQCIIVKDFSRFARNYILVGEYLEQIFPFLGVRFISINDGYDSKTSTSTADNMSMVLKSVLNAYYSKELSQKIRTTFDQKMKRGEILGHPPFGYVLNDERTQYIIDPEAAKTIKRMFELAYEVKTLNEIAGILTAENYLVPSVYIREKRPRNRSKQPVHEVPMWSTTSIQRMLRNRAYSGTLVLNTTKQAFPGSKSSRKTAPEEQYVFENAHEPIVSKEVFDFVQTRFGHKITKTGLPRNHEYVLKGLVVCGNCKRLMAHCHRTNSFTCRKKAILNSQCPQKKFTDSELETAVFQSLQPMLQLLHLTINKKGGKQSERKKWLRQCQRDIYQLQCERNKYQQAKLSVYEEYVSGQLPLKGYRQQKDSFAFRIAELDDKLEKLQKQEASLRDGLIPSEVQALGESAKQFHDASHLTREMATTFVHRILAYDDHIEIEWDFQDVWEQFEQLRLSDNASVDAVEGGTEV